MNLLFNIFLSGLLLIFVSFEIDNDLNDMKKGALIYYGDNFYFIEDYCIMNKDDLSTFPADTCFQVKLLPIHEIKVNARKFKKIKLEGVSEKEDKKWKYIYYSNVEIDMSSSKLSTKRIVNRTDFFYSEELHTIHTKDFILNPSFKSFKIGRLGKRSKRSFINEIEVTPPDTFHW